MKYTLNLSFKDKPECKSCMLSVSQLGWEGESISVCAALGNRPKCPEDGARKDCPLKEWKNL